MPRIVTQKRSKRAVGGVHLVESARLAICNAHTTRVVGKKLRRYNHFAVVSRVPIKWVMQEVRVRL